MDEDDYFLTGMKLASETTTGMSNDFRDDVEGKEVVTTEDNWLYPSLF